MPATSHLPKVPALLLPHPSPAQCSILSWHRWHRSSGTQLATSSVCLQQPHLLPELLFERPLVPVQLCFPLSKLILLQLQGQLCVCFECCDVVLLLVQKVLHFLLVNLQATAGTWRKLMVLTSNSCQTPTLQLQCHCQAALAPCLAQTELAGQLAPLVPVQTPDSMICDRHLRFLACVLTLSSRWCMSSASSVCLSWLRISAFLSSSSFLVISQKALILSCSYHASTHMHGQLRPDTICAHKLYAVLAVLWTALLHAQLQSSSARTRSSCM